MQVIKKHPIALGRAVVMMPHDAKILSATMEGSSLYVHAEHNVDSKAQITRTFLTIAPNNEFPNVPRRFIDTVRIGDYTWHVFELTHYRRRSWNANKDISC